VLKFFCGFNLPMRNLNTTRAQSQAMTTSCFNLPMRNLNLLMGIEI